MVKKETTKDTENTTKVHGGFYLNYDTTRKSEVQITGNPDLFYITGNLDFYNGLPLGYTLLLLLKNTFIIKKCCLGNCAFPVPQTLSQALKALTGYELQTWGSVFSFEVRIVNTCIFELQSRIFDLQQRAVEWWLRVHEHSQRVFELARDIFELQSHIPELRLRAFEQRSVVHERRHVVSELPERIFELTFDVFEHQHKVFEVFQQFRRKNTLSKQE